MDILSRLVESLNDIVDRHLDEIEVLILKVFSQYGCISIYRAANLTGIPISTTYKKARRLIEQELLRVETTCSYRITVKGLLYCVAEDRESAPYMINRIKLIWKLNSKFEEICAYLLLLAKALKTQNMKISQLPSLDSIKDTYRYILIPLITFMIEYSNKIEYLNNIEEIIASALNVDTEIVKMCSKIINNIISNYLLKSLLKVLELVSEKNK